MNLFDYIRSIALNDNSRVAIKSYEQHITYSQLYSILIYNRNVLHIANKPIIIYYHCQKDFIIELLSVLFSGLWAIPVSSDISREEVLKIKEHTNAIEISNFNLLYSFENQKIKGFESKNPNETTTGIYHLTSGTLGAPKLCVRTLENLTYEGISYNKTIHIEKDDCIFSAPPLHHSYALGAAIMAAFVSGASIFVMDDFLPRKIINTIREENITVFLLIPAIARVLCTSTDNNYKLDTLKIALVGAGAISSELYYDFMKKFNVELSSNYGSTETGGLVIRHNSNNYNSIGQAMHGVAIRICDDNGVELKNFEEGHVYVKSLGMFNGYYKNSSCFSGDGFYDMGDIALKDEYGNIYLKGRAKNIIKVFGKNVNPHKVENVIMKIEGIEECVVIGDADNISGEKIIAYIVGSSTKKNILDFCIKNLKRFEIPKDIVFLDSLPKDGMGKVKIKELKG